MTDLPLVLFKLILYYIGILYICIFNGSNAKRKKGIKIWARQFNMLWKNPSYRLGLEPRSRRLKPFFKNIFIQTETILQWINFSFLSSFYFHPPDRWQIPMLTFGFLRKKLSAPPGIRTRVASIAICHAVTQPPWLGNFDF